MRARLALACLAALALAGCDHPTAPPSGLEAHLTEQVVNGIVTPVPTQVVADGDSVVATTNLGNYCAHYSASAGHLDGVLVITLTAAEGEFLCPAWLVSVNYRIVVRPVRRGRHEVRFLVRYLDPAGETRQRVGLVRTVIEVP